MDDDIKKPDKSTIIVHSGDMDKIYSASNSFQWSSFNGNGNIPIFHILGTSTPTEGRIGEGSAVKDALSRTREMDDKG